MTLLLFLQIYFTIMILFFLFLSAFSLNAHFKNSVNGKYKKYNIFEVSFILSLGITGNVLFAFFWPIVIPFILVAALVEALYG